MQRQNMRVILASEYPRARHFLREVVEGEDEAVIAGQAQNSIKALTLARNLRPDVAIIDCHLPHAIGLDAVPLSRMGGLDTAQTISAEIPNARVILLINLDAAVLPEHGLGQDAVAFFSREITGANIPFTLQELFHEAVPPSTLVFANVEVKLGAALRQKVANISDKAVLFGGLSILAGLSLMLTMILAGAGVVLALAGAVTIFLGLVGKLVTSLWPKVPPTRRPRARGAETTK